VDSARLAGEGRDGVPGPKKGRTGAASLRRREGRIAVVRAPKRRRVWEGGLALRLKKKKLDRTDLVLKRR